MKRKILVLSDSNIPLLLLLPGGKVDEVELGGRYFCVLLLLSTTIKVIIIVILLVVFLSV